MSAAATGTALRRDNCNLVSSCRRALGVVLQRIDGESAEQLGKEIGGFLRQHFATEGDVAHLLHAHGIHQERDVRALADFLDGFLGLAHILQVLLVADVLFGHAQCFFQHQFVQLDDVQFALAL